MCTSSSLIRAAIIVALICAGYLGYQRFAGSSASPHDRAVAYLAEQSRISAESGQAQFKSDSITCDSTVGDPTSAEASRLGSDVRLVDCTATTVTGLLTVMCVGVGGKITGGGVGVLSLNHHCADVNKVFLAYQAQAR